MGASVGCFGKEKEHTGGVVHLVILKQQGSLPNAGNAAAHSPAQNPCWLAVACSLLRYPPRFGGCLTLSQTPAASLKPRDVLGVETAEGAWVRVAQGFSRRVRGLQVFVHT